MKKSGAATVGAIVLLSPALVTKSDAEEVNFELSDGTSLKLDCSVTVEWLFDVSQEPDEYDPNKVTEVQLYDEAGNYKINGLWKNKKVYEGDFRGSADLKRNGYWGSDAYDGMYENLSIFILHTAGMPKVGRYSSITHNGNVSALVMEEDGTTPTDDSDVVAKAEASVEGATWTIDRKTGAIKLPEAKQCECTSAATVGTGDARFFVSLGLASGMVKLGCDYLDGTLSWGLNASSGRENKEGGGETNIEGGGSTGGVLSVKHFNTPQVSLTFNWKIRKVKITRYTYVGQDGQTRTMPPKEEFFDIGETERGSAPEDPYVKPPWEQ